MKAVLAVALAVAALTASTASAADRTNRYSLDFTGLFSCYGLLDLQYHLVMRGTRITAGSRFMDNGTMRETFTNPATKQSLEIFLASHGTISIESSSEGNYTQTFTFSGLNYLFREKGGAIVSAGHGYTETIVVDYETVGYREGATPHLIHRNDSGLYTKICSLFGVDSPVFREG
jgi:hypothetical protein